MPKTWYRVCWGGKIEELSVERETEKMLFCQDGRIKMRVYKDSAFPTWLQAALHVIQSSNEGIATNNRRNAVLKATITRMEKEIEARGHKVPLGEGQV